jgi:signal transduction histidine kinase
LQQEWVLRRLVALLALILLAGFCVRAEPLSLDFERGKMGEWRFLADGFARDSLGIALDGPQKNDESQGVLKCFVREGLPWGSVSYVLRDNGRAPIPVTPRTRVAWCWNVSKTKDTDGFWLCLGLRNTKTGAAISARFVSWIESSHDAIRAYFDHDQVWMYHCEGLYDYLWRRFDPAVVDSFVIEHVTLGASSSPNLVAWIDNVWIGEGEPPASVNTVKTIETTIPPSSRLRSFSYGFLDDDWIPDRVDVYRDRAEIVLDPHSSEGEGAGRGRNSRGPAVRVKKIAPSQTIVFDPQRIDGTAAIADLNGDGRDDILFVFDDVLGSRCFAGGAAGTRFREVPLAGGALLLDQEYSYGAAVSDVDRDGDLDVLQINPYARCYNFGGIRLIRNEGTWDFVDGTVDSRILSQLAFGCAFGDVNGDGFQDLFAGYRWYYNLDSVASVNHLYLNDGRGRFVASPDGLVLPGCQLLKGGVFADFDKDGDLDLYAVANEAGRPRCAAPRNMLFRNDGTGWFVDATEGCGTDGPDSSRIALAEDFDNDGLVDLYLLSSSRCMFYRNRGGGRFEAVETELIAGEPFVDGVAADLDADGDMDIALLGNGRSEPVIVENTSGNGRNFIEVRLRGGAGGHAGIGAAVRLYESGHLGEADRLIGYREIDPSRGFRRYAPPAAHFGLGERDKADLEVVFPPVRGRAPVVVRERGVPGGSFLEISEHRNPLVRAVADAVVMWRRGFDRALVRVPAWLIALLALAAIWAAAALVRARGAAPGRRWVDLLLLAAIVVAALLALYRSVPWGTAALVLAFLLTLFQSRLAGLVRLLVQSKSWRESATEFLLEELSQAIHTEKKFAFLMEMSRADEREAGAGTRSYDADFKSLKKLVSMMRLVTPGDQSWRQAGAEVGTMRKILGELRRLGKNASGSGSFELSERTVELQHAIARLNTLLRDYRATLRRMLSVSFAEEWRGIRREYESTLAGRGVALEEALPAGFDAVRIHLKEGEFRHIFKNLLDNSLRAVREAPAKRIGVTASLDATFLAVTWSDTGPGVPKQLVERLFKENVPSSSPDGKGEGCAITGQIMRRRQGVVRLEERPKGRGASIYLKFLRVR